MSITTPEKVKARYLSNEYTDEEINSEIDVVESYIYETFYLPKRTSFVIDSDYTRYFIYENDVYEILSLKKSVSTTEDPSGWVDIGSDNYNFTEGKKYIDFDSQFINENDGDIIRVRLIPNLHHNLATDMVRLNLISSMTVISGEDSVPPQISQLKDKIKKYKMTLKPKGIVKSSSYSDYDIYNYRSISQTDFR